MLLTLSRSPEIGSNSSSLKQTTSLIVAISLVFLTLVSMFWVGFLGSDDSLYWQGAGGWLHRFPYIGDSHWTLRHTLVIPMAVTRRLFGDGMTAMVLPIILYSISIIFVIGVWVGRSINLAAAVISLILTITIPQFILLSSSAYIDLVEVFFLLSGLALVDHAMRHDAKAVDLINGGILIGLAMLSRETTALLVVAVVCLFIIGFGMPRWRYFLIGGGFLLPVGLELLWLWRETGVLFYRSNIAIHHDSTIDRWSAQGSGVPLIHPAIDPFVMILFNHNFASVFWIGPIAITCLLRSRSLNPPEKRLIQLLSSIAFIWVLLAAFLWRILPLTPRYFLFPSVLVSISAGIAFARAWLHENQRLCLIGVGLALCANIVAVSLDNRHFMWGEHVLVEVAEKMPAEIFHTSPLTLRRGYLLLEWKGVADRVVDTPPSSGDLYFYDPTRSSGGVSVGPTWRVVEKLIPPESPGQRLLRHLIGRHRVPSTVWTNLGPGHPPVIIFRVG